MAPQSDQLENQLPLEQRVARLEGVLGWHFETRYLSERTFIYALLLLVPALVSAYQGFGFPNHAYQTILAGLTVALCYHRNWFARPKKGYHWIVCLLNIALVAFLYKFFIGGGMRSPFFWLNAPALDFQGPGATSWRDIAPVLDFRWEPTALAAWTIDLTIIQTFLLLVTLTGALFSFQPFVSFTAFLLVVVSLPVLVTFNWPWVFPALILTGIAFYIQSVEAGEKEE